MSPRRKPRWFDLVDVRVRWLAGLAVALGILGGSAQWGWAWAHKPLMDRQDKTEQNLDRLIEWQQSQEKEDAERKAQEMERARIKACLDSGKTAEECL